MIQRSTSCPDVGTRRKKGGATNQSEDYLGKHNNFPGCRSGKVLALISGEGMFRSGGRNERRDSSKRFWAVLAIIYPIVILTTAESDAGQFLSAVVVVSVAFMLGLIDIVAIFIAYSI